MLDEKPCFQARTSRDSRFDGKFFTGVLTTGIFCRPICPARPAKEENVRYFANAQHALESGFRPCKRCKPEHAPEQMLPLTARRMAKALVTTQQTVNEIAEQFQLSERQFRRNFINNFGIAPKQYRLNHHTLLAKQLLQNTGLSITSVCYAAGFTSVRQFNQQIKKVFACTPTQLKQQKVQQTTTGLNITLHYRPPFDWSTMLSFFKLRQLPNIEVITDDSYQRTITLEQCQGWIKVTQVPDKHALNLYVELNDYQYLNEVICRVRRVFDLDADIKLIHEQLSQDATLAHTIEKFPGLRLPGCWDIFEFSIRAILGQQVSVKAATTLAGRIAVKYGQPLTGDNQTLSLLFPTPKQLENANFDGIGLTQTRINTLKTWIAFYRLHADVFDHYQDLSALEAQLTQLKGIGPWTVNYIAMRGLSDPDAFPAADLGVIKALTEHDKKPTTKQIIERAKAWQPWRAYATLYLWLKDS